MLLPENISEAWQSFIQLWHLITADIWWFHKITFGCAILWIVDAILGAVLDRKPRARFSWLKAMFGNRSDGKIVFFLTMYYATSFLVTYKSNETIGNFFTTPSFLFGVSLYVVMIGLAEYIGARIRYDEISEKKNEEKRIENEKQDAIERELSGANIQATMNELAEQLYKSIGQNELLEPLRHQIKILVGTEVPRLLDARRKLREGLPAVKKLLNDPRRENTPQYANTKKTYDRLVRRQEKNDANIESIELTLRHAMAIVVDAVTSNNCQELTNSVLQEFTHLSEAIQSGVDELDGPPHETPLLTGRIESLSTIDGDGIQMKRTKVNH